METFSLLREFADSWFLIAMFTFLLGTIVCAMRPGSRDVHKETASIPFRNEDHPGSDESTGMSKTEELQS